VRNGSFTEPPELNGLSHLYEHMFFKANRATSNNEDYLKTIDQLGIMYNGQLRKKLSLLLHYDNAESSGGDALHARRCSYPLFDEHQFEQEREVVIGELDRHESNPFGFLSSEMITACSTSIRVAKILVVTKRRLPRRRLKRCDSFRAAIMCRTIPRSSLPGDITAPAAFSMVEELFGDWPRRPVDPFKEFPLVEHPPLPKSEGRDH